MRLIFFKKSILKMYFLAADWDKWYFLLLRTANLLIPSPQVNTFIILTHININPELFIKLVANKPKMYVETHP